MFGSKVRHSWERAPLPEGHRGPGLVLGWIAIALGGAVIYGASTVTDGLGIAGIGAGFMSLGMMSVVISCILREIRRVAFDASLRAGEVEIEN